MPIGLFKDGAFPPNGQREVRYALGAAFFIAAPTPATEGFLRATTGGRRLEVLFRGGSELGALLALWRGCCDEEESSVLVADFSDFLLDRGASALDSLDTLKLTFRLFLAMAARPDFVAAKDFSRADMQLKMECASIRRSSMVFFLGRNKRTKNCEFSTLERYSRSPVAIWRIF